MTDFLLFSLIGFGAGFVNAISGGGGLFALSGLLALGIPPLHTLVYNRLMDVGTLIGALKNFHASNHIQWKMAFFVSIPLLVGAMIGARFVLHIPEEVLSKILLVVLACGVFLLLLPFKNTPFVAEKLPQWRYYALGVALLLVGFWNGAFAVAGVTFALLALTFLVKLPLLESRATEAAAAIPETLISAYILFFGTSVPLHFVFLSIVSGALGAFLGSHLAILKGSTLVRQCMIGVSVLALLKVVWDI